MEGINYKTISAFVRIETFVSRFSKALAFKKFHFIDRNIEDQLFGFFSLDHTANYKLQGLGTKTR